jgi:hypothetical protein
MTTPASRHVDPEIINLSGGIIEAPRRLFVARRARTPRLLGLFATREEDVAPPLEAIAPPTTRKRTPKGAHAVLRHAGAIAFTLGVAGVAAAGTLPGSVSSRMVSAFLALRASVPPPGAPAGWVDRADQPVVEAQSVAEPVKWDPTWELGPARLDASFTPTAGATSRGGLGDTAPAGGARARHASGAQPPGNTVAPAPPGAADHAPPAARANRPLADLAAPPVELNRQEAAVAIALAARRAGGCTDAGDPRATMPVRVTFAPSGQVTAAAVDGGPFTGTPVGNCVARTLRSAGVGSFEGSPSTVVTTIHLR